MNIHKIEQKSEIYFLYPNILCQDFYFDFRKTRQNFKNQNTEKNHVFEILKGQCHEIFVCWFFNQIALLVPLEVPWDDFDIFRKFAEIFDNKSAQGCMIHRGTVTLR